MSLADLSKTPLHLSEGRRLDVPPIDMHHTQSTLSGGVVPEDETDVGLAAPLGHDRQHRRLQAVADTPASQSPSSEDVTGRSLQVPWAVGAGRRGLPTAPREVMGSPASPATRMKSSPHERCPTPLRGAMRSHGIPGAPHLVGEGGHLQEASSWYLPVVNHH